MPYKNPLDQRRAAREHYQAHKAVMKARAKAHNKKVREQLNLVVRRAKDKPCMDCGIKYPYYVMQFDHLGEKAFNIAEAPGSAIPLPRLLREIAKCEVVCANCHMERTHQRRLRAAEEGNGQVATEPLEEDVLF